MSEHMMPIPSRLYNAAVGGHVAGADQIIDDETGLTLDKVTGGALEEKEYTSGSDNGMGRVVLRKNLVEGVNTLTQSMINKSNTIYVIQYDFTLGENITIPANCVLDFNGGSISGAYTLTGNNTGIKAGLVKIFNTNVTLAGTWNVKEAYPEWFGAKGDGLTDDILLINKLENTPFANIRFTNRYYLSSSIVLSNKNIDATSAVFLMTWNNIVFNLGDNVDIKGGCVEYTTTGEKHLYTNAYVHAYGKSNVKIHDIYQKDGSHTVYLRDCVKCHVYNIRAEFVNNSYSVTGSHILIWGSKDVVVDNCVLIGGTGDGDLSIFSSGDVNVTNNTVTAYKTAGTLDSDALQGITIDGGSYNVLVHTNIVSGYYYGIDVKNNTKGCIVSNNIVRDCKCGIATRLENDPTNSCSVEIVDNLITDLGNGNSNQFSEGYINCGIYINSVVLCNVSGNTITTSSKSTTDKTICILVINSVSESLYGPIDVKDNNIILYRYSGGSLTINGDGILVKGGTPVDIINNSITHGLSDDENHFSISLDGTARCSIINNFMRGRKKAILLNDCHQTNVLNNVLNDTFNGIVLSSCNGTNISQNYIELGWVSVVAISQTNCDSTIINTNNIRALGLYNTAIVSSQSDNLIITSNMINYKQASIIEDATTKQIANNIEIQV